MRFLRDDREGRQTGDSGSKGTRPGLWTCSLLLMRWQFTYVGVQLILSMRSLKYFNCSQQSSLVGNDHSQCIPHRRLSANMCSSYLKSVQLKIVLSVWGNRLIINLKTLFFHHFYVNIKLASEKGKTYSHSTCFLKKDFSFPTCCLGPLTRESTLTHAAMHKFIM